MQTAQEAWDNVGTHLLTPWIKAALGKQFCDDTGAAEQLIRGWCYKPGLWPTLPADIRLRLEAAYTAVGGDLGRLSCSASAFAGAVANARLIAAAPEMAELLVEMEDYVANQRWCDQPLLPTVDKIRALLARIKG